MIFRLSMNHYVCGDRLAFPEFAAAVRAAGLSAVGVTRAALRELGTDGIARCLRDHGLGVTSVNSAGYFTGTGRPEDGLADAELIEAAAALGADALCVIPGGAGDPPMALADARALVERGFAELAGLAARRGVTLGLEPIHPDGILTKGCVNSVADALAVIAPWPDARLVLDVNHSWWDPGFPRVLRESPERVALVQLCNVGSRDGAACGRELLASGILDIGRLIGDLAAGGFGGPIEFELFPQDVAGRDVPEVIATLAREFADLAAPLQAT